MSEQAGESFSDETRELFFYEMLDDIRFEDFMLHEPLWLLNSRYPTAKPADREELAEATLAKLLDEGFINVFGAGKEPLDPDEARSAIRGDSWRRLPVVRVFELSTTPEGNAAHDRVPQTTWDRVFPDRLRIRPRQDDD